MYLHVIIKIICLFWSQVHIGCHGKKCNEICYVYDKVHGVCDLEGSCIPFDSLPFPFDLCDEGCNFKKCGFFCQVGGVSGFCDTNMNCEQIVDCGKHLVFLIYHLILLNILIIYMIY